MLFLQRLYRAVPVMVLAGAFIWSGMMIVARRAEEAEPGTITLRIAHWQLEAGVRDAFEEMAAEYQKLHPDVRIQQEAIPDQTYGQWMTTQLIGGNAPDIMQIGFGLPWPVLVSYFGRYFVPLTRYANQPNPYNAGTELEGVSLRQTYKDAMRAGYVPEHQEYMMVPLSIFGVRIFYNKDLYEQLTGRTEPPQHYREFIKACRTIAQHRGPTGKHYVPIAASRYHMFHWESLMFDPLTYPAMGVTDFNRDGAVGNTEVYAAFRSGLLDWDHPALEARFQMVDEITDQFQTGFTGLSRDEAVFLFAQQRAVFITTGTWDARSLQEQAEGAFEVGIMDFPMPTPDDPEYGDVILGPVYEMPYIGFPFAITRTSPHVDQALDFLQFLASKEGNEKLNRTIGWIPAIRGAETTEFLEAFEPNLVGVYSILTTNTLAIGGETAIKYAQLFALYLVNQISYAELTQQYNGFYLDRGAADWIEANKDWRRGRVRDARLVGQFRVRALHEGDNDSADWIKYRGQVWSRLINAEVGFYEQRRLVTQGAEDADLAPYAYKPAVWAQVKARLARELEGAAP